MGGWSDLSACAGKTSEFYAHRCTAHCYRTGGTACAKNKRVQVCQSTCAACPVLAHCRMWSIESNLDHGIAGGMTESQRYFWKITNNRPARGAPAYLGRMARRELQRQGGQQVLFGLAGVLYAHPERDEEPSTTQQAGVEGTQLSLLEATGELDSDGEQG